MTGPRQSGKTTLARLVSGELGLDYITLDDQATMAAAESDPHGFIRSLGRKRVVLDEFQYAPALIPAIKEVSDHLESMIYMECCKHAAWAEGAVDLWHFRDNRKREVDIVLEREDSRIVGIEVKAAAHVRREDFKGLAVLADFAGSAFERGVLFYGGQASLPFDFGGVRFHALPLGMLKAVA